MQIETYKIEHKTTELDEIAQDVNAIELIQSLELTGQSALVNTKEQTRVAFRRMTLVEQEVYSLLFPEKTRVERFDAEIIPLRVLITLKEAKDSQFFVAFEVWHARTKKEDPILVGIAGTPDPQAWNKDYIRETGKHLIARWGDALLPFDTLLSQAKKVWLDKERKDLTEYIQDKQNRLTNLELEAEVKFAAI